MSGRRLSLTRRGGLRSVSSRFWLLLILALGCRKLDTLVDPPIAATTTTTVAGRIVDDANQALPDVSIKAGGKSTTTDAHGIFVLSDIPTSSSRVFVIASKPGYFSSGRAAIPSSNGTTYLRLALASNAPIGSIDAATGGTISIPAGGKLLLQPRGIVTQAGAAYSGAVSVSARHLDPADSSFSSLFAGDLMGMQGDGKQTLLTSAGVIIAELHGENGELLQPAQGQPAVLTMPISAGQQSIAPAMLPLWYFDESIGMWKEEGSATRSGNEYVGRVQHFTLWNYDWKVPFGEIRGRIVCDGKPVSGITVDFGGNTDVGSGGFSITGNDGVFVGRVPANGYVTTLRVDRVVNGRRYYINSGRTVQAISNATVDLGDIQLASITPARIMGAVKDCNGRTISGLVEAVIDGDVSYTYTQEGTYSFMCWDRTSVTLTATVLGGESSAPMNITPGGTGTVVQKDIIVCTDNGHSTPVDSSVFLDIEGNYNGQVLTFSPDGKTLATLDVNLTDVVLIDVRTGKQTSVIRNVFAAVANPDRPVRTLSFSGDGGTLVSMFADSTQPSSPPDFGLKGSFDCWKLDGSRLTPVSVACYSATPSQDGKSVFYVDDSLGYAGNIRFCQEICEYDVAVARSSRNLSTLACGGNYGVGTIGFTNHPNQLVLLVKNGYDLSSVVWNTIADSRVSAIVSTPLGSSFDFPQRNNFRLSRDGTALGVSDGTRLRFYGLRSGYEISHTAIPPPFRRSFDIAADNGSYIAQYRTDHTNLVGQFTLEEGKILRIFGPPANAGFSTGVAFSPDGTLAAAVYDSGIRIWNVK